MQGIQTVRVIFHHIGVQGIMWSTGKTARLLKVWKRRLTMHIPKLEMS